MSLSATARLICDLVMCGRRLCCSISRLLRSRHIQRQTGESIAATQIKLMLRWAMSTIERAFAIAREGKIHTMDSLKRALRAERYDNVDAHLSGGQIKAQLVKLMASAREAAGRQSPQRQ